MSLSAPGAPAAQSRTATRGASAAAASSSMDLDAPDGAAAASKEDVAAGRARKTAAATAAAVAACAQLAANAKGPYGKLHSSEQVALLGDAELWDTIAENWCKPGKETISAIVATWEGRDLAACVSKLGLPVLYAKKNYESHMRRSVVEAVRKYAKEHPELFEAAPDAGQSDGAGTEASDDQQEPCTPSGTPPARDVSAQSHRRSPRAPASSRSLAAMGMAALQGLPAVTVGSGHGAPGAAVSSSPSTGKARIRSSRSKGAAAVDVSLLDAGAGESEEPSDPSGSDDDDDSDWSPHSDSGSSALHRDGRMRREDVEHELARAGVSRSFAKGFVRNAVYAAGGRTMYQLYKEVTAAFAHESSKRECLALSRVLDALLRGDSAAALEHTCRRLGGVHTAAETGNWAMCERLETEAEQRSFVPDTFMRSALKSVTQMAAVKKSAADGAAGKGAFSKAASASGRGERRSPAKPYKKDFQKDRENNKENGASTSQKKKGGSGP